ncbi:OB-fold domain-containing protein [Leptospira sp. 2 VSF19]|uniref:OB-fold domain-containing protein n=1 Tax=Leptospira soteropolitanensis TaxID=2950025 RepID=A0AAW5V7U7_9LEPT|nr:OB-fold domain-containing protein [Leptospira soteropolitanensis]MCW7491474.1 OB-fold domain-containing protein [Leptospira soteropolitanensis]MCW7499058.1 OB-fold domain-containing protein [Leptospira soteropolitanensis]MCW7521350.1 OB-fold domain-containing protein [Leptospira soteropolitanensis]MCW7525162.1 OB-fold domain-containing protein [Leptospira soteropolitanensis]MCW7529029.1 OB-fold domain-containing protein [Leptospira soteropolitanensis]
MSVTQTFTGTICNQCNFKVAEVLVGCPSCGSESIQKVDLKQNGTIHSFTVVYVGFGHMATRAPYVLAIVQTEENVKLTTVIEGVTDFNAVKIGDKVRFKGTDEKIGPVFQY